MFSIAPQLIPSKSTCSAIPEGWFVPGADRAIWVRAAHAFARNRHDCRYFVVPRSLNSRAATGLVCLSDGVQSEVGLSETRQSFDHFAGAVPLQFLRPSGYANALWIPCDACVSPVAAVEQILADLVEFVELVWLPASGLVRFETSDALRISQMVCRPSSVVRHDWAPPSPTTTLPDRISDIRLLNPPLLQELFGQDGDSIGDQADSLMNLNADGTTKSQGWINQKLNAWMQQKAGEPQDSNPSKLSQFLSQKLQNQREKQIEKLLDLLKRDPDRALQFAIPMGGLGQTFRGIAEAGGNLVRQSTDFSLSSLFGGSSSADYWDMQASVQSKLRASYEEQAKREIAAGRYRRAAFIQAHLLGNHLSAAQLLERGGHFNEAAVLFGDHLHRPEDQARCLAAGGQSNEAVEIYIRLEEYEKAAGIWEAIGDTQRARSVYERAVTQKLDQNNVLAAADLLIHKLDQADHAEALLCEQWPRGAQPLQCAQIAFERYAQSERHEQAAEQFQKMDLSAFGSDDLMLARLAAWLFRNYPDPKLKATTEDRCRIAATNNIRNLSDPEIAKRTETIRSMHSGEKILERDLRRFQRVERKRLPKLQGPVAKAAKGHLTRMTPLRFPRGTYPVGAMIGNEFFAMATDTKTLLIRAANLRADAPEFQTHSYAYVASPRHVKCCPQINPDKVVIHLLTHPTIVLPSAELSSTSHDQRRWPVKFNRIAGETRFGTNGESWTLLHESMTLSVEDPSSCTTIDLKPTISDTVKCWGSSLFNIGNIDNTNTFLAAVGNQPVVVCDQIVITTSQNGFAEAAVLNSSALFVAASLPFTQPRILVGTKQFLKIIHLNGNFDSEVVCNEDGYEHGCFLFGGGIAATTDCQLRLFERHRGTLRMACERKLRDPPVVDVFPIGTDTIGVFYKNGILDRHLIK